ILGCRVFLRSQSSVVIPVDADPVHFAPTHHLILAHHGDIVFTLASDHARVAAIALRGINGHRPLVALIKLQLWVILLVILVEGQISWRGFVVLVRETRILLVFLERRRTQNLPALHVVVILRTSDRIIVARYRYFAAARRPQRI